MNPLDDICDRDGNCADIQKVTSKEIHDIGLTWKVKPEELLFENWMPVDDIHLQFRDLDLTDTELVQKAKELCGVVSFMTKNFCHFFVCARMSLVFTIMSPLKIEIMHLIH